MKKERRVYTKATDKLKKLFDNESAAYFSNVGQDDETGVVNSHGLYLEDADEVGQFEFLHLVGRHDAFVDESVVGFRFDGDYYDDIGWAPEMETYVGVTGIISKYYRYDDSFDIVFDSDVDFCYPAELVAKHLDVKQPQPQSHYDNTNGSLYKIATDLGLNHWEFDLFKRLVRCRKKGEFEKDLQKIKDTCDIYLREYK